MGRDADPTIKIALTEKILAYLLKNGIHDLSLRPLAAELGSNARMLIYHFGSKEQMIVDALALAQNLQLQTLAQSPPPQEDSKEELIYLWQWFSSDDFIPFSKLLFQIEAQAVTGNELYLSFSQQTLASWTAFIKTRFDNCNDTSANLIVSTISGLLLDKVINNDAEKINKSFQAFAELMSKNKTL